MKNKIRDLRAARGWSQAALADLLDVSRQTVNAIETGRYDPSLPLAFAIAGVFETLVVIIIPFAGFGRLFQSSPGLGYDLLAPSGYHANNTSLHETTRT